MHSFIPIALLAATAHGTPLHRRADADYQVTSFAAGVAAHSITQSISFDVTLPGQDAVACSNATGAVLSSTPYLIAVNGGRCGADGSGLSFNFEQVEDQAIRLEVAQEGGATATYAGPTGQVAVVTTGSTPLDTATVYSGPADFNLTVPQ